MRKERFYEVVNKTSLVVHIGIASQAIPMNCLSGNSNVHPQNLSIKQKNKTFLNHCYNLIIDQIGVTNLNTTKNSISRLNLNL